MAVKSTMIVLSLFWLWCESHSALLQARRTAASGGESTDIRRCVIACVRVWL